MHILLLTPQLPYPPQQGTSLRNYHMLKALAQTHQISLLSFTETDLPPNLEPLHDICRVLPPVSIPSWTRNLRLWKLFTSPLPDLALRLQCEEFSEALEETLAETNYDAVQVEGLELATYIENIRTHSPRSRVVLDCHNAETELQRRALKADLHQPTRWPAAMYSALQIGRLDRFEKWAMCAADAVLAVSESDRLHLRRLAVDDPKDITIIPNMIDTADYIAVSTSSEMVRYDLVFTGKMDYRPNIDGVLWFAENVWPLIQKERPQTTWAIVGQKPHPRLDPLRKMTGITVTGWVEAVQPYLLESSIYIVPLRIGSGTRLKILEAMAAAKPVISTTIGVEGFEVEDQKNIILADDPADWVRATLELLDHPARRAALAEAGRRFAEQYDWHRMIPVLSTFYSG